MAGKKRSISLDADLCVIQKEWDETMCPICMEHPHNAVLLLCTSHSKGCKSYICDTSYRHSNCLDRFKKLKPESSNSSPESSLASTNLQISSNDFAPMLGDELPAVNDSYHTNEGVRTSRWSRNSGEYERLHEVRGRQDLESLWEGSEQAEDVKKLGLKCPLCRGDVLGWTVVEEVRDHLNLKGRSCTHESCTFVGNYRELRRHARSVHPRVRPAEVNLSRQRAWTRFEHQREHDDIVSAIRSQMPGAVVLGDYVIEDSDRLPAEREGTSGDDGGSLLRTLFVFQMVNSMAGSRSRPWPRTRHRRLPGSSSRRRYLWGENLLGLQDEDGDGDDSFTDDEELNPFVDVAERHTSSARRQRRRLSHSGSRRDRS